MNNLREWSNATFIDKKGEEYSWNFWTKEYRDKFVEETKEFTRAERESHWKMYYEQKK